MSRIHAQDNGPIVPFPRHSLARNDNDDGTQRSHRLAVRTSDSHSGNTGSIPVGTAKIIQKNRQTPVFFL